jgi:hypothetical protein
MAVAVVYSGLLLAFVGMVSVAKPLKFLGVRTRLAGAGILLLGVLVAATGAALPAPLLALPGEHAHLDEFVPACQFREVHSIRIHAPTDAVFRAVRSVTAREIRFFRFLTWIRSPRLTRAGREDILAAPADKPILDVALRSGFVLLADDPSRELVFGTILCGRLPGVTRLRAGDFLELDRPGFCKVAMNFRLRDEGGGSVRLSTETRVLALDPSARRRFAVYWRVISPGSALIRRMWLEAIRRRAEDARSTCLDEIKLLTDPVDLALADFESADRAPGRKGSVRAAESVLAKARLAREKLEAAPAEPACGVPRREILIFLNHVILGFAAYVGLGSPSPKDSDNLGEILRRARAHQKRAITSSLLPDAYDGVPGTARPRRSSETA